MGARRAVGSGLVAVLLFVGAGPGASQSTLERTANLDGPWVSSGGVLHFNVMHRFWVTGPPARKVVNTPTILVAAGLPAHILTGLRYGSNSSLMPGEPNEWEVFARWRPVSESATAVADVAVTAGWNGVAESFDGELSAARSVGPVRLLGIVRAFSSFAGGGGDVAVGGGAVLRLHRNVGVAADLITLTDADTTAAWSVGLQLRIPTTPHTVSLHATNAAATTLQSSVYGGVRRLYGFEFTVPVTLSRYIGGRAEPAPRMSSVSAPDTARVRMDNRLRFLPDTVRIRVGEAVQWENTSDLIHTVTADPSKAALESSVRLPAGAEPFDSGDMDPGAVYIRVFDRPGTYGYFCIPHEQAGMVGWVVVEE